MFTPIIQKSKNDVFPKLRSVIQPRGEGLPSDGLVSNLMREYKIIGAKEGFEEYSELGPGDFLAIVPERILEALPTTIEPYDDGIIGMGSGYEIYGYEKQGDISDYTSAIIWVIGWVSWWRCLKFKANINLSRLLRWPKATFYTPLKTRYDLWKKKKEAAKIEKDAEHAEKTKLSKTLLDKFEMKYEDLMLDFSDLEDAGWRKPAVLNGMVSQLLDEYSGYGLLLFRMPYGTNTENLDTWSIGSRDASVKPKLAKLPSAIIENLPAYKDKQPLPTEHGWIYGLTSDTNEAAYKELITVLRILLNKYVESIDMTLEEQSRASVKAHQLGDKLAKNSQPWARTNTIDEIKQFPLTMVARLEEDIVKKMEKIMSQSQIDVLRDLTSEEQFQALLDNNSFSTMASYEISRFIDTHRKETNQKFEELLSLS